MTAAKTKTKAEAGSTRKAKPAAKHARNKPALDRTLILSTALALIDRDGVAALSLRGLANELGVFPTAIYWHVPNRNALIAGAIALALEGVGERLPGGTWQARLRGLLKRYRQAVHRHPKLAAVIGAELVSNSALDLPMIEHIVLALEAAGFDGSQLVDAYNVVIAAMCGFVTLELAAAPSDNGDEWAEAHARALTEIPADEFPAVARHLPKLRGKAFILRWTSGSSQPLNSAFEAWVDVVVGGLEKRVVERGHARSSTSSARALRQAQGDPSTGSEGLDKINKLWQTHPVTANGVRRWVVDTQLARQTWALCAQWSRTTGRPRSRTCVDAGKSAPAFVFAR